MRGARVLWALERLRSARLDPHGVIPELDPPDCGASRPEQRARDAAQYADHRRALLRETKPQQRAECRVGEGALAEKRVELERVLDGGRAAAGGGESAMLVVGRDGVR